MQPIRNHLLVAILTVVPLLAGCLPLSVQPLYDESSLVFEPGLVGVWGDPEGAETETWEFRRDGERSYRLVIRGDDTLRVDPDRDGVFIAHLARLGGETYLDLFPEEPEAGSDLYKMHIVPGHSFWKLRLQGHVLELRLLDGTALERLLANEESDIAAVERDDVLVLTDTTQRLQDLVIRNDEKLFVDSEVMRRVQ